MRWFIQLVILVLLALLLVILAANPTAYAAQQNRTPLTLELLQDRVKNQTLIDGNRTINLRETIIDLRPSNAEFREQFYQILKTQLNRPGTRINLDLSSALIQGDFNGNDLGLRLPLLGESLSSLFSPTELEQLQRDRRRLSSLQQLSRSLLGTELIEPLQLTVFRGQIKLQKTRFAGNCNFNNTFFLEKIEAQNSQFLQSAGWVQTRFSKSANFTGAVFNEANFRGSIFFNKANFNQTQFLDTANFAGTNFETGVSFSLSNFKQPAKFSRSHWQGNADFSQSIWQESVDFTKSEFNQALFLSNTTFKNTLSFRGSIFNQPVNLRGASILDRADFSDSGFAKNAFLNVDSLTFDSNKAKIVGNTGEIGKELFVPSIQGNENLLRNLVQNFRLQQQIPDANQVEYTKAKLKSRLIFEQIFGINLNTTSRENLIKIGFSPTQTDAIISRRIKQPFRNLSEILNLDSVDLATYVKVREKIIAGVPVFPRIEIFYRISTALGWLSLTVVLLLSQFGTNSSLVFGIGIVAIAYFGLLFWLIDRCRRRIPKPILATQKETIWILSSFLSFAGVGLLAIFRSADQPWLSLTCLTVFCGPIPLFLVIELYRRGRYHDLINVSYFVEEGSLRQLRLMIGRLPIIPRFPMFRERYLPLLWDRGWNWLNYYDFSFNNFLKVGFNDIRLRDEHIPGLISTLIWYQWSLGVLYLILLFWTLSRTIPGLNLLIYLK
ncbi:pentapeptide repeat-containing protein [Ancylothrix sp. C2]|uniref:pentapeptide repeat-containing protein n=1 Tax=Ancylothrix sp. D3o TaxID=2953691 RepID=UPI0021BB4DC4|nr:pentapeptide repeat-containing protein [Ancylothrix sp. D3o]MCT7952502.1 pentapeptide repeat-containing protein [Ancylothrix sp. D3o]